MTSPKNSGPSNGRFIARGENGQKRCSKCREHRALDWFKTDRSRFDGMGYLCRECRKTRKAEGPAKPERHAMLLAGLRWCRGCTEWKALPSVGRQGVCQPCANAEARKRYRESETYRLGRRAHSTRRKRGVEPVPALARGLLLEEFDYSCAYCPQPAQTWDHIRPVRNGGVTEPANIVPACIRCNSSKRDRDVWEWLEATGRRPHDRFFERIALADI